MPLTLTDLKLYGSAVMPDDNAVTNIGGAIATSKKADFSDFAGLMQVVSSSAGDTTQTVQVFYRDASGALLNETKTLNGLTPVTYVANIERLLKGVKTGSAGGNIALENQSAERSGTLQNGTLNTVTLDVGASAVDGFYNGMIIRLTGGPGANQINQIIDYVGATKIATLQDIWRGTIPTAATTFRIATGFFFERNPNEISEVRRVFYDASANAPGGGAVDFFDKIFFMNASNAGSLLTAQVVESLDPSGKITFGLDSVVNGTSSNGAGNNRKVAPSGIVFGSTPVDVPGSNLNAGSNIGVWLKLSLADGDAAQKTSYTPQLAGTTV